MKNSNQVTTFSAIIVAGVMIAGAIIYSGAGNIDTPSNEPQKVTATQEKNNNGTETSETITKVSQGAHILGSPDAEITIIVYSDIECPYCRKFHKTMHQIVDKYGATGQVAWEYRHFPIKALHPTAPKEAEATECAAELGGETKFWEYLDYLSENSIPKTNIGSELVKLAGQLGLDESAFNDCLDSGRYTQKIKDSLEEGTRAGVRGTPNSIVTGPNGQTQTIPGALPFEQVDAMIQQMLAQ